MKEYYLSNQNKDMGWIALQVSKQANVVSNRKHSLVGLADELKGLQKMTDWH